MVQNAVVLRKSAGVLSVPWLFWPVCLPERRPRQSYFSGADRTERAGASYFRITSLGGKNKLYGTAVIYR
ncbi:TPA: DUF1471 domain-containing protein [Escherichia coli]|nr:DUF1471 domain-containing protein [Escherichia coli]